MPQTIPKLFEADSSRSRIAPTMRCRRDHIGYPLIAIAIFSQLSAAIADVIGGSGSLIEVSRSALSTRATYFLICLSAIALCWATTTLTILALTSRAFAFYYLMQCLVAITVSDKLTHRLLFGVVGATLAFITVFAVAVG